LKRASKDRKRDPLGRSLEGYVFVRESEIVDVKGLEWIVVKGDKCSEGLG